MPRLFVAPERLTGPTLTLTGDDHRYLDRVLRLVAGQTLEIFDGLGMLVDGRIVSVGSKAAVVALGERRLVALPRVEITLLQAVPRGDRMDLIVQKATELGVSRIVPVLTARCVARPMVGSGRATRWQVIAEEAARQSGRSDVPDVGATLPFSEALAAESLRPTDARLVLWESARGKPLRQALGEGLSSVTLFVGPEGGFAPDEIAQAESADFAAVGLGARILRVETAAIVAVALVQAACGGLD